MSDEDEDVLHTSSRRRRRRRTIIPPDLLEHLEAFFSQERWPNRMSRERMARVLGRPEPFVSIWFQNKRARVKKEQQMMISVAAEANRKRLSGGKKLPIARKITDSDIVQANSSPDMFKQGDCDQLEHIDGLESSSSTATSDSGDPGSANSHTSTIVDKFPETRRILEEPNIQWASAQTTDEGSVTPTRGCTLFRAIINMVSVVEGGIISPTHPEYDQAANDALYGILLNNATYRLVYDKHLGLDILAMVNPQ